MHILSKRLEKSDAKNCLPTLSSALSEGVFVGLYVYMHAYAYVYAYVSVYVSVYVFTRQNKQAPYNAAWKACSTLFLRTAMVALCAVV